MSQDILQMVQNMDPYGLERQLAMQCAPLIVGLKISNLLMLPAASESAVYQLLKDSELSWFVLRRTERNVTMLLYREKELRNYLASDEIRDILMEAGYRDLGFTSVLHEIRLRYKENRDGNGDFPHEMGAFLGYPPEDVKGFIDHHGRDFQYSGYWKVYDRVEEKKRLFHAFEIARDTMIELLHAGISLPELLQIYSLAESA